MSARTSLPAVSRSVVATVREREVTFLAAGISYYVLVSLVPILTLAVVAATVLGGADLAAQVQSIAQRYLLPTGSELVTDALADGTGRGTVSALSLAVTVWGALKLFRGVDVAFARIYGYPTSPLLRQLSDGLVTLVTLGVATVGVALVAALVAVADLPLVDVLGPLVLLGFLAAAFVPLYAVIPDVRVPVRQAFPGALVAAVGWAVLSAAFGLYAQATSGVAGALGGLLLLVTWFYLSGLLVLTGAAVNAVLSGRTGLPGVAAGSSAATATSTGGPAAEAALTSARDRDRQLQHPRDRRDDRTMSEGDATTPSEEADDDGTEVEPRGAPDIEELEREIEELRADLDAFEEEVDSRTVDRPEIKSEMRRYVRGRLRRGKARGWGPYLVLLYGTAATIAAFYFLSDLLAVVAMLVIYLSTLGLYLLFVIFGVGLNALGVPGRLVDWVRDRRS
ncbi:YhjD/YihY/BrkB family envelope integrity protein [Halobellus sp. EA9]|uniref:YihY/virulence factor BrkB family protein n=1 Tax=Halobellus sp. EA9 TaxID=3421647 RepID=UPI003EBCFA3B